MSVDGRSHGSLRSLNRNTPSVGTSVFSPWNFRLLSQHRSPGSSSYPPPHLLLFCLARFVKRHKGMDQIMFGLPKREDKPSYQDTCATNSCTCQTFQPNSCGSSGSFALFLRFHTPFHDHRQDNTLARSSSSFYHFIIGLRPGPVFHLDQPFWCSGHDYIQLSLRRTYEPLRTSFAS